MVVSHGRLFYSTGWYNLRQLISISMIYINLYQFQSSIPYMHILYAMHAMNTMFTLFGLVTLHTMYTFTYVDFTRICVSRRKP